MHLTLWLSAGAGSHGLQSMGGWTTCCCDFGGCSSRSSRWAWRRRCRRRASTVALATSQHAAARPTCPRPRAPHRRLLDNPGRCRRAATSPCQRYPPASELAYPTSIWLCLAVASRLRQAAAAAAMADDAEIDAEARGLGARAQAVGRRARKRIAAAAAGAAAEFRRAGSAAR